LQSIRSQPDEAADSLPGRIARINRLSQTVRSGPDDSANQKHYLKNVFLSQDFFTRSRQIRAQNRSVCAYT